MGYPNQYVRRGQLANSTTAVTGAAPQTVNGNAVQLNDVADGTLGAKVVAAITTNTITVTCKWQVSDDGSTWIDVVEPQNPANVTFATGTGSLVTTTKVLAAPSAVYGFKQCRLIATTGVATAGGDGVENITISYWYRRYYN